jgi:hypothetical protein
MDPMLISYTLFPIVIHVQEQNSTNAYVPSRRTIVPFRVVLFSRIRNRVIFVIYSGVR